MLTIGLWLAVSTAPAPLQAQATEPYPTRPVRLVVPFAPGGAVDATARIIGAKIQEAWGQPVIIENKPGVGGNLAADSVAKADPDGYTILQTTVGQSMSPSLYKSLPYDTLKDLSPVTQLVETGLLLVANPKVPANDLRELVALAKAKPGELNYGHTGQGNPLHLAMEMLMTATGIRIQGVPFRGDAPLNTALISGDIQVAIVPVATALANIEAKMIKALGVSTVKRTFAVPDLPTIAEQGVPGFAADSWQGLFVPSATPRGIIERIHFAVKQAMGDAQVQARMKMFGSDIVASSPDVFAAKFRSDVAKYAPIIKAANIPLQ
jgi:tripartite-type tricarboxylate transporter receptor subunit TctC